MRLLLTGLCAALLGVAPAQARDDPSQAVDSLLKLPQVIDARARLAQQYDQLVGELITLTEIAAPPFKEAERAAAYAGMFRAQGATNVSIDKAGNVLVFRPGADPKAGVIVISAHLDTVFAEGIPVKVRREGTRLYAPGIGDDTRGLANLLAYARVLDAARIRTRHPVLFVATVGEEGTGNNRGVRYLLSEGAYAGRITGFFSVDDDDAARVTHIGVGVKRYRVHFTGPGGHSYNSFGIVNPLAAMARAIDQIYRIEAPAVPKTTFAVTIVGGGTSVNAIPGVTWFEVDLRSENAKALADLDAQLHDIAAAATVSENQARATDAGAVSIRFEGIGDRPAGETPRDGQFVRTTAAVVTALGYHPNFIAASTDSNVPMSIGVPAVTIGAGGHGGREHSTDEWVDVTRPELMRGAAVGLVALLAAAGVERE